MAEEPPGFMQEMASVAKADYDQLKAIVQSPFAKIGDALGDPAPAIEGLPPPPTSPARRVADVASALVSIITMPLELANTGFAMLTSALPSIPLPAATLMSLYVGPPHAHAHPPSLVPPSPVPVPLPSLGPMLVGVSVKVIMAGFAAARAGDIAVAMTCGSLAPGAATFTGSSKVFVAGTRAARTLDMMNACARDAGGPVRGFAAAMMAANQAVAMATIAADSMEAGTADDPHLAAARSLAATMGATQMAADAAALAMSLVLGTDPAIPPLPGYVTTMTSTRVLIGGFPMMNIPDPAAWLFGKAQNRWKNQQAKKRQAEDGEGAVSCQSCPK